MAAGEEAATVFVETSLGTHLAVSFPARNTTVAHLKRIVSDEHAATFPRTGQIAVESFKVRRRGSRYHLTDSVPVRAAFHRVRGAWHLHAHVLPRSAPPAAAHPECDGVGGVRMLHHAPSSQRNAIGDAAATDPQGSDAPSTDGHLGDAHEGGYSPVKVAGVIEDPRGRKRFRENEDGYRDQNVLVGCDAGSLAALGCSVTRDGQNDCRHSSMSKRICAAAREDGLLGDSDDEVLEDEGALDDEGLDFLEKKEGAVTTRPSDLAEPPVELRDHKAKSITKDEEPKLCFSVNKNDFAAATEKHADFSGMIQEKLVGQQDHLDTSGAEVALQNCNSKDTSAIHSEHVSDCHQYEGPSRSFDLKCCKSSKSEMLTDQVADRERVCSNVEKASQEKENDDRSDPLLHDLDDCACSLEEKPICGQKEPLIAEVCNSASSKKGKHLPPCGETLKEVSSSEKEGKVECNGERSSNKGADHLRRAGSMKEGKSPEKEEMAQKIKEKEPWTDKACNGETSSSKGTDHPPCAGSMREGNSSERERVAHGENQSKRTVKLVDVDGTKWEIELDDSFELGPQESSSFSWSEKEDAEENHNDLAKPRQNAEELPHGAPENGGTRIPTQRSDLPRHGSFKTPMPNGPTESKHVGATSADSAEQGAWERTRRPRDVVRKIPNSRAAKMYGYR